MLHRHSSCDPFVLPCETIFFVHPSYVCLDNIAKIIGLLMHLVDGCGVFRTRWFLINQKKSPEDGDEMNQMTPKQTQNLYSIYTMLDQRRRR